MEENETTKRYPVSVVRFGIGKEIQLYADELVITGLDELEETRVRLDALTRLTLVPGDPTPSKLVLIADFDDGTSSVLVNGMTNARGFREMLPHLLEFCPGLELDPPDMSEQLGQALNNRRAWSLTCLGACILVCLIVYGLYLLVAFLGTLHH
jgi:hypothetical protein